MTVKLFKTQSELQFFYRLIIYFIIFSFIQGVLFAQNLNSDLTSFFKESPLELTINVDGEKFDISIKNISSVTLVLSKRALLKLDILWFIKVNGQRVTSGVRGETSSHGDDFRRDIILSAETLLSDIKDNKEFVVMKPGELVSSPISKESFIASGVLDIADSISKSNPLDVTVALTNPIAGFFREGDHFKPIVGQLTLFSIPLKLDRIPSLK